MNNNFLEKMNISENKYISYLKTINNSQSYPNDLFKMLEFISKNSNDNINELYFSSDARKNNYYSNNKYEIIEHSIFYPLSYLSFGSEDWNGKYPNDLFSFLRQQGLEFFQEANCWSFNSEQYGQLLNESIQNKEDFLLITEKLGIKPTKKETVFSRIDLNQNRSICFLRHVFEQIGYDDFVSKLVEYNTLHTAVTLNKLDVVHFLIKECKVDANLFNKDRKTPLMFCNKIETLEELSQYDLNWFAQDIFGKDCISYFSNLSEKTISLPMVNIAQKNLKNEDKFKHINKLDEDYVQKRIKHNLLELVQADKTKAELASFIKKYKISDFSDILDKDNNSLAQICLKNKNWARYNIFKDSYSPHHKNNAGLGYLEIIFSFQQVSRENEIKAILLELLDKNIHKNNTEFGWKMIKQSFSNDHLLCLPIWLFNRKQFAFYARKFLPEESAIEFSKIWEKIENLSTYNSYNVYRYSNDTTKYEQLTNGTVYFYLSLCKQNETKIDWKEINLEKIFTFEKNSFDGHKFGYNDNLLFNVMAIISQTEKNKDLNIFYDKDFVETFEHLCSEHILKSFHYDKKNNQLNKFFSTHEYVIDYLLNRESPLFLSILSEEMVNEASISPNIQKKMSYHLLNNIVKEKTITKRSNKI